MAGRKAVDPPTTQLQIGEVAKRAGVSIRTVRFYEEKSLLPPASLTSGGIRLYTGRDVNRLIFIRRLKMLGLSIGEIRLCLGSAGDGTTRATRVKNTVKLLNMQKEKLEELISMLSGMKKDTQSSLEKVTQCLHCTSERCPQQCPNHDYIL
jgi:MerR family transcriptional regulator, Zn(II)-responsive regulator of zntA